MRSNSAHFAAFSIVLLWCGFTQDAAMAQTAMDRTFTYQGKLEAGGSPAEGPFDFRFRIFDSESGGVQYGATQALDDVQVIDGIFAVELNIDPFDGDKRWLEIGVRPGSDPGAYTTLLPRQKLTAVPYAMFALLAAQAMSTPWSGLVKVPAGFADGVDDDTTYTAGSGLALGANQFSVLFAGSGAANSAARSDHNHGGVYSPVLHGHEGADIASGTVAEARIDETLHRDAENKDVQFVGNAAGTTTLNEITSAADSGAVLIGVFDEFANSASTNVQAVLNDLDAAVSGVASPNLFETVTAPSGTAPAADSPTDTLRFLNGAGISISGDAAADSLTVAVADGGIDGAQLADTVTLDADFKIAGGFNTEIENSLDAGQVLLDFTSDTPAADTKFLVISKGTTAPIEIFSVDEDGDVVATTFSGDGSLMTALNATNVATGTVAEARIDGAIARDGEIMPTVLAGDGAGSTLDADLLDGIDSAGFAAASHGHDGADIASGTVAEARIDALIARDSEIMPTVLANDGAGSTLDGDLVDGLDSTQFLRSDVDDVSAGSLTVEGDAKKLVTKATVADETAGDVIKLEVQDSAATTMFSVDEDGDVVGTSFAGNGSGLTALDGSNIANGTVAEARIDAAIARDSEILPTVLAGDGAGSTLDADLLDGIDSTGFAAASHGHDGADIASGTVAEARIDGALHRDAENKDVQFVGNTAGTTTLNEITSAADSGAVLIGVFDEFANSASTNVQAVLNDLDAAVAATGLAQNVFETISAPAGTNPVADSTMDTLSLANGNAITITGDSGTDTISVGVADDGIDGAQLADTVALDADFKITGGFNTEIENSLDAGQVLLDFTSDTPTADTKFFAISKGTAAPTEIFSVDEDGDVEAAGDLKAAGGFKNTAGSWYEEDVVASQTAASLDVMGQTETTGGATHSTEILMAFPGSILAITVVSTWARTGGTLTLEATVDGIGTGFTTILDGVNTQFNYATAAKDAQTFVAGSRLGVTVTTDASWAPTFADIVVTLIVEF